MSETKTEKDSATTLCPCGTGKAYADCCEPIITGTIIAETAEAMMRSRYSAYVKGEIQHIINTIHSSKKTDYDEKGIRKWSEGSVWVSLEIVNCQEGTSSDDSGTVEFIAHYRSKGLMQKHHELATFKKEGEKWTFFEGEGVSPEQYKRPEPKTGRNEPCPCGSSKKFKKCCGKPG
ncbi:MAG: YchJ family protein [Fibrobacteria bacterium]|nr:YchJ family protein [Fibrobacteria bacterium]